MVSTGGLPGCSEAIRNKDEDEDKNKDKNKDKDKDKKKDKDHSPVVRFAVVTVLTSLR
jgi:hypothetical protein